MHLDRSENQQRKRHNPEAEQCPTQCDSSFGVHHELSTVGEPLFIEIHDRGHETLLELNDGVSDERNKDQSDGQPHVRSYGFEFSCQRPGQKDQKCQRPNDQDCHRDLVDYKVGVVKLNVEGSVSDIGPHDYPGQDQQPCENDDVRFKVFHFVKWSLPVRGFVLISLVDPNEFPAIKINKAS